VGIDEDTVTNAVKKYAEGGLQRLLENKYRKPKGQLDPYVGQLKDVFEKQPPHTVNQAIAMIFEAPWVRLKHSTCREFLKKIGLKCRRCGLMPGKVADDEKQQQAQQAFHDPTLQPRLDEAKQGKRTGAVRRCRTLRDGGVPGNGVVFRAPVCYPRPADANATTSWAHTTR
jgi:transposase